LKMLQFPKCIMLVAISTFISMTGRTATHQSTGTLLQESSHGGRFSYDPRSREQTAVNTFLVRAVTHSAKYLHEIACTAKKARILEDIPYRSDMVQYQGSIGQRIGA